MQRDSNNKRNDNNWETRGGNKESKRVESCETTSTAPDDGVVTKYIVVR